MDQTFSQLKIMLLHIRSSRRYVNLLTTRSIRITHNTLCIQIRKDFISKSSGALNDLLRLDFSSNPTLEPDEILRVPSLDMSNPGETSTDVELTFENFDPERIELDWMVDFLAVVGSYIVQAIASVQMLWWVQKAARIWSKGGLAQPSIDLRVFRHEWDATTLLRQSPLSLVSTLVYQHPTIILLPISIVVGSWVVGIGLKVYVNTGMTFHEEHINLSSNNLTSTSWTREMIFSLLFNFAYQKGSTALLAGALEYDRTRNAICSENHMDSIQRNHQIQSDLLALAQSHNQTSLELDLFQRCVNFTHYTEQGFQFDTNKGTFQLRYLYNQNSQLCCCSNRQTMRD
mmetsp:Transcript_80/g.130  ORF Transcript_80/g.130 Transcript_80/m.130 type:complete len:344 (-) Transcript_80:13-1044(-)